MYTFAEDIASGILQTNAVLVHSASLHAIVPPARRGKCQSSGRVKVRRVMTGAASGVAGVAAARIGVLAVGALAGLAVRALETAENLGAGFARGCAAVCAREPSHALDDPKPRCAASRAQSAEFFRQVLGRETDPVEVPEVGFMQALAEYAQMFMCTDLVRIRHVAFDDFSGHAGLVYTPTGLNV